MPKRGTRRPTGQRLTTHLPTALRRAQNHPRHQLIDVHPRTAYNAASRGLARPGPDGTGWFLTEAGQHYTTQP